MKYSLLSSRDMTLNFASTPSLSAANHGERDREKSWNVNAKIALGLRPGNENASHETKRIPTPSFSNKTGSVSYTPLSNSDFFFLAKTNLYGMFSSFSKIYLFCLFCDEKAGLRRIFRDRVYPYPPAPSGEKSREDVPYVNYHRSFVVAAGFQLL